MPSVKQPPSMQKQEANMTQEPIMWMLQIASRNLILMVRFVLSETVIISELAQFIC
jgi:hypothetical protein